VRTAHLLAVAGPILAVLAFAPAVPVLSPALCLVALLAIGELAVRALVREPLTPAARLGLATAAGLVSLPLMALILHVLGVRIEGRWLATGLTVLAGGLGACTWKQSPSPATPPHPVHWVGGVEQPGTTTSAEPSTTSAPPAPPHPGHWVGAVEQPGTTTSPGSSTPRTLLAVGVPALLAILIGGTATVVYERLPHPAEPGYTSLALAGWAAGIARPVAFPAAGLEVPLEVSSAGEEPIVAHVLVRVGGRITGPGVPVPIAGGTRPIQVHVPAPPDGCLHAIRISLGPASTVFYGRGPGPALIQARARPGHPATRTGPVPC
jgi:hypothetical protein